MKYQEETRSLLHGRDHGNRRRHCCRQRIHLMKIAIVTGASSGMGEEFCRHLDRKGLDEIWIIARRAGRLESLAETLSTHSHIIPGDLTDISTINNFIFYQIMSSDP